MRMKPRMILTVTSLHPRPWPLITIMRLPALTARDPFDPIGILVLGDEIGLNLDACGPGRRARQNRLAGVRLLVSGTAMTSKHRFCGGYVSAQRRERRQAPIQSPAQGRPLAQDHVGAVRLVGGAEESYLKAQFLRLKARRGPKKAIMAVAASILTAIYHMLKDGTLYQDLGSNHFQSRSKGQQTKRLVKRLADLGYDVALTPVAS